MPEDEDEKRQHEAYLEKYATTARKVAERGRGCLTPAEDFITQVLVAYDVWDEQGEGLPPWVIEQHLETFKEDQEDMLEAARSLLQRYPDEKKPPQEAPPELRIVREPIPFPAA
jgi:hypothetical protein